MSRRLFPRACQALQLLRLSQRMDQRVAQCGISALGPAAVRRRRRPVRHWRLVTARDVSVTRLTRAQSDGAPRDGHFAQIEWRTGAAGARPWTITRPVSGPRTRVHAGRGPSRVRADSIASAVARARTDIQCRLASLASEPGKETVSFMPIQGCLDVQMSIHSPRSSSTTNQHRAHPVLDDDIG